MSETSRKAGRINVSIFDISSIYIITERAVLVKNSNVFLPFLLLLLKNGICPLGGNSG
jgi:hypothetical protein